MTDPVAQLRSPAPAPRRATGLRAAMEAVVLAVVVASPWAFGAVHPLAVLVLYAAVAVLLVLWAGVLVVERGFPAGPCPVAACLAALVVLGLWQLAPLPPGVLSVVSPGTAAMRDRLIPSPAEGFDGGTPIPPAARTISLDAGATRADVTKLLAVLALFAVVRYGVASAGSFRRLAAACVANGVALSGFALAQRFGSPPGTIYWWFPAQGDVYGPFVCRNHFPFYTNVAAGLGVGLLLATRAFRERGGLARVGRHPAALWLLAALGFVVAANVLSLSRGGVVAAAGAAVGVGLYAAVTTRRVAGLAALALAGGLGMALVGWLGADRVGKRLNTLADGTALEDGRADLWRRVLPLAAEFPVWGTGYGTFEAAELHRRPPSGPRGVSFEHAHNEYLNALVEGGACQLLLLAAAAGLVFGIGVAAHRRLRGRSEGALVLGGLLGLGTAAIHSFGDFGLHVPAVVALVTVVAAQVTAAGRRSDARRGRWLVAPVVLAAGAVAAALPADGWRRERADRFRIAALRAEHRLPPGDRDLVVRYLDAAVGWAPDDALLRQKRADVRYDEYLARRAARVRHAELAAALTPGRWAALAPLALAADPAMRDLEEALHAPALGDYLAARNLNPLLPGPHLRLAGNTDRIARPDAPARYLDRACFLDPVDAGNWYLAGLAHLAAGNPDRAAACWRRSLECGPAHLPAIVSEGCPRFGAESLLDRVVPADPDLLTEAAKLPPLRAARPVVVSRLLDVLGAPTRPDRIHFRAGLLREAGRPGEAVAAYRAALDHAPSRTEWRFELAGLLLEQGDAAGAGDELRRVLRDRPDYPGARDLAAAVRGTRRRNP